MKVNHSFPIFIDSNSKILILGSSLFALCAMATVDITGIELASLPTKVDGVYSITDNTNTIEITGNIVDKALNAPITKERIQEHIDFDYYIKNYQITKDNLPYATFLMHPGPINKGIEIAPDVLEMQNAKTILNQARNGVYVRMAILDMLLASQGY